MSTEPNRLKEGRAVTRFPLLKPTHVGFAVGDLAGCVCKTQPVGERPVPRAALPFQLKRTYPC